MAEKKKPTKPQTVKPQPKTYVERRRTRMAEQRYEGQERRKKQDQTSQKSAEGFVRWLSSQVKPAEYLNLDPRVRNDLWEQFNSGRAKPQVQDRELLPTRAKGPNSTLKAIESAFAQATKRMGQRQVSPGTSKMDYAAFRKADRETDLKPAGTPGAATPTQLSPEDAFLQFLFGDDGTGGALGEMFGAGGRQGGRGGGGGGGGRQGPTRGQLEDQVAQLRQFANEYVQDFSDSTLMDWATRMANGQVGMDSFRKHVEAMAISDFPDLAPAIKQGQSVRNYADRYVQKAAQILEKPPESIDLNDPKFRVAIDSRAPDGKRMALTLSEWEAKLKTDSTYGWDFTQNAKDQAAGFVMDLQKLFGARG